MNLRAGDYFFDWRHDEVRYLVDQHGTFGGWRTAVVGAAKVDGMWYCDSEILTLIRHEAEHIEAASRRAWETP